MLDEPATISGGGGDDQLTFALDADVLSNLAVIDLENAPANLDGFQAVLQDDQTIIAYVKDIDLKNIKTGSSQQFDKKSVFYYEGTVVNIGSISNKEYKLLGSPKNANFDKSKSDISDSTEKLTGTSNSDSVFGSSGDDSIAGAKGDDVLGGGRGVDKLNGNSGNDLLYGHQGDDIILGGHGDDAINGGSDHDLVRGHGGNDFLFGGNGADTLHGGNGDDFIDGGKSINKVKGGDGYDSFYLQNGGHQIIKDFDPYKDKLLFSEDLDRDLIDLNRRNQVTYGDIVLAQLI